ncbi:kinase-like domain-containing protein [Rhizophagus irregularis DAOM 181602=DAOM 197198]|nr:kinase-like domain-containing protein [Rhizophagus irregularis DAOM 181602=DAOM 197198]
MPKKLALTVKFGKSENAIIDDFIFKNGLKWIPYNKFKNVKGGFGTIYKATWLKNNRDEEVILKCHKDLNKNLNEFLKEWEYHTSVLSSNDIINFYGFTEDPNASKYMVVMDYANKDTRKNLIYCDFHDGNILNYNDENKDKIYISDLGLCQPFFYDYVGTYIWVPPFNNRAHDIQLCLSICKGERPEIIENTPQCYVDLMKKCWNEDPLKRPSSKEVLKIIEKWIFHSYEVSKELKSNIMEFINAPIGHNNLATKSHPKACYTSRLLDFTSKKLNKILDTSISFENTSKKSNEILESEGLQS